MKEIPFIRKHLQILIGKYPCLVYYFNEVLVICIKYKNYYSYKDTLYIYI